MEGISSRVPTTSLLTPVKYITYWATF